MHLKRPSLLPAGNTIGRRIARDGLDKAARAAQAAQEGRRQGERKSDRKD